MVSVGVGVDVGEGGGISNSIHLRVANLDVMLHAQGTGIEMDVPETYESFLARGVDPGLRLVVRSGALREGSGWQPLHADPDTWQLWRDEQGRYVFVAGRQSPPARQVTVDAQFVRGEVLGHFDDGTGRVGSYPLQDVDVMLFVNWLAASGDVLLHATGVEVGGRGYCFAGGSGAGKSTLAATLAQVPGSTMLGEDNVILRNVEGRFWIFGTPWHLDPAMCSSGGAPLSKLFFLDRKGVRGVRSLSPADGVAWVLQTAFVPYYRPEAVVAILDRLALLAEEVPFYTLSYELGADVRALIREA